MLLLNRESSGAGESDPERSALWGCCVIVVDWICYVKGLLVLVVLCAMVVSPALIIAQVDPPTPTVESQLAPTVCASNGQCGFGIIVTGYSDGAEGSNYLIITILLFGFSILVLLRIVDMFVLRRQ